MRSKTGRVLPPLTMLQADSTGYTMLIIYHMVHNGRMEQATHMHNGRVLPPATLLQADYTGYHEQNC